MTRAEGMLPETVHAILKRLPEVASFRFADEAAGRWCAAMVECNLAE